MIEAAFPLSPAFERATKLRLHRKTLLRQNPHCTYCGRRISKRSATLDHVVPVSQGGQDDLENLVLCCRACNECKAGRTPTEWIQDILAGLNPG